MKDEAAEQLSPMAQRAPLHSVVDARPRNYVTRRGLHEMRLELARLEAERFCLEQVGGSDTAEVVPMLASRIAELQERLASLEPVDPPAQGREEVRFGAVVTARDESGRQRSFQIVGVDEADPSRGRVSFVSPVARALLGRRAGEIVAVELASGVSELQIVRVAYYDD